MFVIFRLPSNIIKMQLSSYTLPKLFLSCTLLFLSFFAQAQKKKTSPQEINSQQNLFNAVRHDTCLTKKFSVVVYLIQDSLYQLTVPPATNTALATYSISAFFNKLNATFSTICVSFEHCKTIIIPNHTYNIWKAGRNGNDVIREWYTENTICLYIPDSIPQVNTPDNPTDDYTFNADTLSPYRNAIVIKKRHLMSSFAFHVFGHFFGLPHTYAEINPGQATTPPTPAQIVSKEFVKRSNCYTHGDGFCDTEADPFPTGSNLPYASLLNCIPLGLKDGMGNFYTPPTENYMSIYADCRCKYSPEQYLFMAHYILRKRLYLH